MIATDIRLFDESDHPWIANVLDVVERSLGQPWRVLLERIEDTVIPASSSRVTKILDAMRRTIGGRAARGRVAQRVRGLVLGNPALDRDTRDARIAAAACVLGIVPSDVESLLWADLAKERPVTLPSGRPRESTLAAFANLDRIQSALRRARTVQIRIGANFRIAGAGDASSPGPGDRRSHELVRAVARYGLIANITRDGTATVLDITGPLALFHATTVYGRALASLVPLLADHDHFSLEADCDFKGQLQRLHVRTPVALPQLRPPSPRSPNVRETLARGLAKLGWKVEREPAPIAASEQLLFPDLVVTPPSGEAGTWIEVIGFSTTEYLDARLAAYRDAGIERIRLLVDRTRCGVPERPEIVAFAKRIDPSAFAKALGG